MRSGVDDVNNASDGSTVKAWAQRHPFLAFYALAILFPTILSGGKRITKQHFSIEAPLARESRPGEVKPLAALEREAIERALALVGGNRRTAAERLGIGLRTLYDKRKRYGLE